MAASELIAELQKLIDTHGDREVYLSAPDYPDRSNGVHVQPNGDPYVPAGAFRLY